MNIPGLHRIPLESSDPNDKIELVDFKGQTFTVPGAYRHGNCRPYSDFERLCKIGEGSFGIVYKVREKTTNKIFALKKLKIDKELEFMPQNFLREITSLKLLKHHPNIVNLVDVAVEKSFESTYLVLEFCKYSLSRVIDDDPEHLQHSQIKNIMFQLFTGLDFIHRHGIFHRDVNPSNILFTEDGILKITDFDSSRKNATGNLTPNIGTQWYRAPEILFGSVSYSYSADIWSAGCIFAELLIHKVLFRGDSDFDVISLIVDLLGPPLEEEWPEHTKLPVFQVYNLPQQGFNKFKFTFINETNATLSLIREILVYNPAIRLSAEECLKHPYFYELPEACSFQDLACALDESGRI